MPALLERLRDHITRARLFPEAGIALVAVSGGSDSVALLDLMHELAPELGLALIVAHADHGIRADSRTVAQAVADLARGYRLPCALGELGLGPAATETAARRARYAWLGEVRREHGARYVITAHHGDDQVETILMRVLKGSAPAGLAGMRARGRGVRGGPVRPLLPFTRAALAAHVAERGLPVHEDPANRDPRHLRSWLRVELLPLIVARLGPHVRADLLRLGHTAGSERRAWEQVLELLPELHFRVVPHGFEVARAGLGCYDDALSVTLLRAAARRVGLVLGIRRAKQLTAFARRPSGRQLSLGAGGAGGAGGAWSAEVAFDRLRVFRRFVGAAEAVVAGVGQGSAVFGKFRLEWVPDSAPSRLPRAEWTTWIAGTNWQVRAPRPGDRLVPLGGVGHRPLRRLLMEARVPRSARASYPVVARGETILWVPGVCRSAASLPQPGTPAVRVDVTEYAEPEAERRD